MKLLSVTLLLLVVGYLLAYVAGAQSSVTKPATSLSLSASCVQDEDTFARIHDEVVGYARSRGLSEEEFGRRVGRSIPEIEELTCAAEISGNSVPGAMQALENFGVFFAGREARDAAVEVLRWAALCEQNVCEAASRKLRNELR
jgi:hypothetical protein